MEKQGLIISALCEEIGDGEDIQVFVVFSESTF
jgi:hypothetical protein